MSKLKVGKIGFANCTPIFMALSEMGVLEGVDIVNGVPTELNRMLNAGELDLCPSSSIVYLKDPARFGFLPDFSISSIGKVQSVFLFSKYPLGELGGRRLGLSKASATSVVLTKVILQNFHGVTPEYTEETQNLDARLSIGDQALKDNLQSEWPHTFDLGEAWYGLTATPFVFALWIGRRDLYLDHPALFRDFYKKLVTARQLAYRSYARYSAQAPEAGWLAPQALLDYWSTISYDLTAWHLEGLKRFASEAQKLGEITATPDFKPFGGD